MIFGIGIGASGPGGRARVDAGVRALRDHPRLMLLTRSALVEGPGVGTRPGAWFVNAAALVDAPLHPRDLLRALQGLERRFGRVRLGVNAPRTLDLDLLVAEGTRWAAPDLQLPHPRLAERPFALAPLRECLRRLGLQSSPNFFIR